MTKTSIISMKINYLKKHLLKNNQVTKDRMKNKMLTILVKNMYLNYLESFKKMGYLISIISK